MQVSRVEIAEHLATSFMGSPVSREQLVESARHAGARPAVLQLLGQLGDGLFREVRELWPAMPDVPIERPAPGSRRIADV